MRNGVYRRYWERTLIDRLSQKSESLSLAGLSLSYKLARAGPAETRVTKSGAEEEVQVQRTGLGPKVQPAQVHCPTFARAALLALYYLPSLSYVTSLFDKFSFAKV